MAGEVPVAIKAATSKLGRPYIWGATGPDRFDCSGLTQWAWKQAGVSIPRTSQQQAKYGTAVRLQDIRAGDLVTSDWGAGPSSHVALYVGGGKLIHAPKPGKTITYATLDANYKTHINAIRRVPGSKGAPTDAQGVVDLGDIPGVGIGGDLLGGVIGGATGDGILGPVRGIANATSSIASGLQSVGTLATWTMKLALPSTWVRIGAGTLGALFLFLGLGFLVRETRGA